MMDYNQIAMAKAFHKLVTGRVPAKHLLHYPKVSYQAPVRIKIEHELTDSELITATRSSLRNLEGEVYSLINAVLKLNQKISISGITRAMGALKDILYSRDQPPTTNPKPNTPTQEVTA